jgi:hypothetical protein
LRGGWQRGSRLESSSFRSRTLPIPVR